MARRLLFLGCVNQLMYFYKEEKGVYADLVAEGTLYVDQWAGIEFGNIDESDEMPPKDIL